MIRCVAIVFALLYQTDNSTISKEIVGDFKIGMSADDVYSIVGKENTELFDQYLEAMYSPALAIKEKTGKDLGLLLELSQDKVWRMVVFNPAFKTKNQIGVGNTLAELKKKYPAIKIFTGEGNVVAFVKELNMSFCLDTREIKVDEPTIENIRGNVRIVKIFVLAEG